MAMPKQAFTEKVANLFPSQIEQGTDDTHGFRSLGGRPEDIHRFQASEAWKGRASHPA